MTFVAKNVFYAKIAKKFHDISYYENTQYIQKNMEY
jgi:hypothetical protein